MTSRRARLVYAIMSGVMSVILSCGFAVYYVTEQNQKLCNVIEISISERPVPPTYPVYTDAQPETDYGKLLKEYNLKLDRYQKEVEKLNLKALAEFRQLSKGYHCPEDNG